MSTWMWDLLGGLVALFVLVVTVVDVLIGVAVLNVLHRWWHDHRTERTTTGEATPAAPPAAAPQPVGRSDYHTEASDRERERVLV